MRAAAVQEKKERKYQERKYIVRFKVNGRESFVYLTALSDCDDSVYYERARLAYRQEHRGEPINSFVGLEIIEIGKSVDIEPPRPNTAGYRKFDLR